VPAGIPRLSAATEAQLVHLIRRFCSAPKRSAASPAPGGAQRHRGGAHRAHRWAPWLPQERPLCPHLEKSGSSECHTLALGRARGMPVDATSGTSFGIPARSCHSGLMNESITC